jgi:preprotein translocase subunit SecD
VAFLTRWKVAAVVLLAALVVCLFVVTNFFSGRIGPHAPVSAQRDLRDATNLLLQIDADAVRKAQLQALNDDARRVLRQARIPFIKCVVSGDGVEAQLVRDADVKVALDKLDELSRTLPGKRFVGVDITTQRSIDIATNGDLVILTPSDAAITERIGQAVDQSIEIIRRRIRELGLAEPNIRREGPDRILVQVLGVQDMARLKEVLVRTAKLEFRLVDLSMTVEQAIATQVPPNSEILDSQKGDKFLIEKRVLVSGTDLIDAQPRLDPRTNEPLVSFRFDSSGTRKLAEATQQNVDKPFAIVLDNQVVSVPVIREPILGGSGLISGNFTVQEANDLAILLRAGALPAPLTVLEEHAPGDVPTSH